MQQLIQFNQYPHQSFSNSSGYICTDPDEPTSYIPEKQQCLQFIINSDYSQSEPDEPIFPSLERQQLLQFKLDEPFSGEQQSLQSNQYIPVNPLYTQTQLEPNESSQLLQFSQCPFTITSYTCKRPGEPTSRSPGELQPLQCTLLAYSTHPHVRPTDATLSTTISDHHNSIHAIPFAAATFTLILTHLYKRFQNLFHQTSTTTPSTITPNSRMQQSISYLPAQLPDSHMITKSSASADAQSFP